MGMLSFFTPEDCIIIRRGEASEDDYGNPVFTEIEIESKAIFAFRNTYEISEATGSKIKEEYKLVFEDSQIIENGDVFKIRNQFWENDGTAISVTPSFGEGFMPAGQSVYIKRVERNG